MFAQVGRGGDAWVRKEVGELLRPCVRIVIWILFRWARRLPQLSAGPHSWVYTDTQVFSRPSSSFLLLLLLLLSSNERYQRTRESARRFKEGMGLSTSLPPPGGLQTPRSIIWQLSGGILPEPNRRLLAFYNICAEYKKAIFQVFEPKPWLNNETTFFRERKQRRT